MPAPVDRMIYLKSALAGIVAVVLAVLLSAGLLVVGTAIYLWVAAPEAGGAAIAWDPTSAVGPLSVVRPGVVFVALAVFVSGFLWEFRRASR